MDFKTVFALFIAYIPSFLHGLSFMTSVLCEDQIRRAINTPLDHGKWILTLVFISGGLTSCILCFATKQIERKHVYKTIGAIFSVSYGLYFFQPFWLVAVGRFMTGIATGYTTVYMPGAIQSIITPEFRIVCGSLYSFFLVGGLLAGNVIGYLPREQFKYVIGCIIALSSFFMIASTCINEAKNTSTDGACKDDTAQISNESQMYGKVPTSEHPDMPAADGIENASEGSDSHPANSGSMESVSLTSNDAGDSVANEAHGGGSTAERDLFIDKTTRKLGIYKSFFVVIFYFLAQNFSGINHLVFNATSIFMVEDATMIQIMINMVAMAMTLGMAVLRVLAPRYSWLRWAESIQITTTVSCILICASCILFFSNRFLKFGGFLHIVGFNMGLSFIPWILVASVFPPEYKNLGAAVASLSNWATILLSIGFFQADKFLKRNSYLVYVGIVALLLVTTNLFGTDRMVKSQAEASTAAEKSEAALRVTKEVTV